MIYYYFAEPAGVHVTDDQIQMLDAICRANNVTVRQAYGTIPRRLYVLDIPSAEVIKKLESLPIPHKHQHTIKKPDTTIEFLTTLMKQQDREIEIRRQRDRIAWAWVGEDDVLVQDDTWRGVSAKQWLCVSHMFTKEDFGQIYWGALFSDCVTVHTGGYRYKPVNLKEIPDAVLDKLDGYCKRIYGASQFKLCNGLPQ